MLGAAPDMRPPSANFPPPIVVGSQTDPGRRENNEDALRCVVLRPGTPAESWLLMVSDGVGGANAGEVASRMAVENVEAALVARFDAGEPPAEAGVWLASAARVAGQRIQEAAGQAALEGMAATLSALWLRGAKASWVQAGDSRIYLFRSGALQQLTRDQSPVGRMRAAGQLTEEEARKHPYRHMIDQCLGGGAPVEPEVGELAVAVHDVFLLCSDGLSDGLWDREIAEVLAECAEGAGPDECARVLTERALAAATRDNVSVIVARVDAVPAATV